MPRQKQATGSRYIQSIYLTISHHCCCGSPQGRLILEGWWEKKKKKKTTLAAQACDWNPNAELSGKWVWNRSQGLGAYEAISFPQHPRLNSQDQLALQQEVKEMRGLKDTREEKEKGVG